jgi:hypothetical protein
LSVPQSPLDDQGFQFSSDPVPINPIKEIITRPAKISLNDNLYNSPKVFEKN